MVAFNQSISSEKKNYLKFELVHLLCKFGLALNLFGSSICILLSIFDSHKIKNARY